MPQAARRLIGFVVGLAALVLPLAGLRAAPAETRIALVIGNGAYPAGALATAANDAGLVAQTLQAAGFDVVGARDLDEDGLRRALRDFTDRAAAAGPEAVAFVYLAGYGLQVEGENYFVPVDARIGAASDVPLRALRVSDYAKRLAALPLRARFLVLDAGRRVPFRVAGEPLAGGLALVEAEPDSLVAFNAAPGTVAPEEPGPYGAYAQALAEMMREGGLAPAELFARVRLRVSETTRGAAVPWHSARIGAPFVFFERGAEAPPLPALPGTDRRPLGEIGPRDAFARCLEQDSLQAYEAFLAAYPQDPLAKRVRAILAARREALTWRRSRVADTPNAYWSYLDRYPRGPHAPDARRRLRQLAAAAEPPDHFAALAYDVPPPPPEERIYVERPVVVLDDPADDLPPPPVLLPPRPAALLDLPPPPPVVEEYVLPAPVFVPVPAAVRLPAIVAPPEGNPLAGRIHERPGPTGSAIAAGVAGAAIGAAVAARVALPPSLSQKAALRPGLPPGAMPAGGLPGQPRGPVPPQAGRPGPSAAIGQPLPGQPLPGQPGRTAPLPAQARPGPPPIPGQALPGPAAPANRPGAGAAPALRAQPAPGAPPRAAPPAAPVQALRPGWPAPGQPPAGRPASPHGPVAAPAPNPDFARQQQVRQEQAARAQAAQAQAAQARAAQARAAQAQRAAAAQRQQMMMQQQRQEAARAFQQRQQVMQQQASQAAARQQAAQAAARQQQMMMQQQAAAQRQHQMQMMQMQRPPPAAPRAVPQPAPHPGHGGRPCGQPGLPPCR